MLRETEKLNELEMHFVGEWQRKEAMEQWEDQNG